MSQSVIRKANELGMKNAMENNLEFSTKVLCLPALAHIPLDSVVEAFELLAESMPTHEQMDELLSYFEHTYIRGRRRRGQNPAHGPPLGRFEGVLQGRASMLENNKAAIGFLHSFDSDET